MTATKNSNLRNSYRRSLCLAWVRRHRPDVWYEIVKLAIVKYPGPKPKPYSNVVEKVVGMK